MAVALSQPKMVILNDIKVSRMIAEEAIHNQAFRDLLSDFASTGNVQTRGKKFQAIDRTITEFRKQIADEAGLKAPKDGSGHERSLSTYLKQVTHPRVLVGKASAQEEQGAKLTSEEGDHAWGWVVSNQVCLMGLAGSHLALGKPIVCCTLGFVFPAVNAPLSGRPVSVSL